MFPLKLVRSFVSGNHVSNNPLFLHIHNNDLDEDDESLAGITISRTRVPLLIFTPTHEFIRDTYRLASIARDIGMDLQPNPSLSHVIFSWPSPLPELCNSTTLLFLTEPSKQLQPSSSSSSLCTWSLPNNAVPLPFPSFRTASLSHLRLLVNLSKGYFKLCFLRNNGNLVEKNEILRNHNWHCTSLSLFATHTSERIQSMDGFSKAMLGRGWTLFRSYSGEKMSKSSAKKVVFLYRKMNVSKISRDDSGECSSSSRVRELKFPSLVFRNMSLRILQYILLMTDDIFYLA